jgi:NADH:ubiquinone oxidoreductase subunit 3 (subunit A)
MFFIKTNVSLFQFKQTFYFDNYRVLLILILVLIVIGIIIFFLVNIFNNRFWTITQMHSIYECGFLPFEEARVRFEPKFYMVALSFIIFDLEICFIFPWLLIFNHISMLGFLLFSLFLLLILVGIFYEWKMGIFDWSTV